MPAAGQPPAPSPRSGHAGGAEATEDNAEAPMIRWLLDWWHARQRSIDMQILWPTCCEQATKAGLTLDHAKAAFAVHAFHDEAWLCLGEDEITRRIDALEAA